MQVCWNFETTSSHFFFSFCFCTCLARRKKRSGFIFFYLFVFIKLWRPVLCTLFLASFLLFIYALLVALFTCSFFCVCVFPIFNMSRFVYSYVNPAIVIFLFFFLFVYLLILTVSYECVCIFFIMCLPLSDNVDWSYGINGLFICLLAVCTSTFCSVCAGGFVLKLANARVFLSLQWWRASYGEKMSVLRHAGLALQPTTTTRQG